MNKKEPTEILMSFAIVCLLVLIIALVQTLGEDTDCQIPTEDNLNTTPEG